MTRTITADGTEWRAEADDGAEVWGHDWVQSGDCWNLRRPDGAIAASYLTARDAALIIHALAAFRPAQTDPWLPEEAA